MRFDLELHTLRDGRQIFLRSGAEADAAALLASVRRTIRENAGMLWEADEFDKTEEDTRRWIADMLANSSELLLLAEMNGAIVGNIDFHIGARRRIRHAGQIGMAVVPECRGHGIGRLLLDRMITWARSVPHIERVELSVISNNTAAIGLYRSFGFLEEGRHPNRIKYADGTYADDLFMGLSLREAASSA